MSWQDLLRADIESEKSPKKVDPEKSVNSWRRTSTKSRIFRVLSGLERERFKYGKKEDPKDKGVETLDDAGFIQAIKDRMLDLRSVKRVLEKEMSKFNDMSDEEFLEYNDEDMLMDDEWRANYKQAMDAIQQLTSGSRTISPEVSQLARKFVNGDTQPLVDKMTEQLDPSKKTQQGTTHFIEDLRAWENKNDELLDKVEELANEEITALFEKAGFSEAMQAESQQIGDITGLFAVRYLEEVGNKVGSSGRSSKFAGRTEFLPFRKGLSLAGKDDFFNDIFIRDKILSPGMIYILENEQLGNIDNIGRKSRAENNVFANLKREYENNPEGEGLSALARLFGENINDKKKFLQQLSKNTPRLNEFKAMVESQRFSIPENDYEALILDEREMDTESISRSSLRKLKNSEFSHVLEGKSRDEVFEFLSPMQKVLKKMEKSGEGGRYVLNPEANTIEEDKDAISALFSESVESQREKMAQEALNLLDRTDSRGARTFEGTTTVPTRYWKKIKRNIKESDPTSLSLGKIIVVLSTLEKATLQSKEVEQAAKEYFGFLQFVADEGDDEDTNAEIIEQNRKEVEEKKEALESALSSKYSTIRSKFLEMLRIKMNRILANPQKYPTKGQFNMASWLKTQVAV